MRTQAKAVGGSLVLIGSALVAVLVLISPGFAAPAGQLFESMTSGLDEAREGDLLIPVATARGVHIGAPVYLLETGHETTPVAHVVSIEPSLSSQAGAPVAAVLRVRFAPGAEQPGPWGLQVLPPRRGLGGAYRLAVSPEMAREVGGVMLRRLEQLWRDVVEPTLQAQLPDFLARIDPRGDNQSKQVLRGLSDDAIKRLRPLMNEMLNAITRSLEKRFDLWDRMGVLWKFVRGDGKGLKRKIQPVAEKAAKGWWDQNQARVFGALGDAFQANLPAVKAWLETEVLRAAREALLLPVLERHGARLESEGEALMRLAVKEIVQSDEGGFRVRFASMLRMTLLGKKRALLLLERPPTAAK